MRSANLTVRLAQLGPAAEAMLVLETRTTKIPMAIRRERPLEQFDEFMKLSLDCRFLHRSCCPAESLPGLTTCEPGDVNPAGIRNVWLVVWGKRTRIATERS